MNKIISVIIGTWLCLSVLLVYPALVRAGLSDDAMIEIVRKHQR